MSMLFMTVFGRVNEPFFFKYRKLYLWLLLLFFPPLNNSKCGSFQPRSVSHTLEFFIAFNLKHMHGGNELEHSVMVSIYLPSNMSKGVVHSGFAQ